LPPVIRAWGAANSIGANLPGSALLSPRKQPAASEMLLQSIDKNTRYQEDLLPEIPEAEMQGISVVCDARQEVDERDEHAGLITASGYCRFGTNE